MFCCFTSGFHAEYNKMSTVLIILGLCLQADMGKKRTFKGEHSARIYGCVQVRAATKGFLDSGRDLAPCKAQCGDGSFHVLSLLEKRPVCFLLCQCSAFAQLLMSTSSSAPAAAPPLAPIHSAFQQPPATEPHITHPAQPPLSPGEKGSILTLWCHCCGRWPPPPTSMPAHHTQIQEHQHHNNYFPAQKRGSFVS